MSPARHSDCLRRIGRNTRELCRGISRDPFSTNKKTPAVAAVRRQNFHPQTELEDVMILPTKEPDVSPFRLIVSAASLNEPVIACPVCGGDYVHIRAVETHQNHTHVHVHGDDCDVTSTTAGSRNRGSSVTIRFWGECGHEFSYTWSFHKGNTRIFLHDVDKPDPYVIPSLLWRD